MIEFTHLKKNLKKDYSTFKEIKIALIGDSSTQFLTQALRGMGYEFTLNLQIFEADFNQIEAQIYNPNSELYQFKPEVILIFQSSHKLLLKYNKLLPKQYAQLCSNEIGLIKSQFSYLSANIESKVIYYNYTEIDDVVYGNFGSKFRDSFIYQIRKLNYELMEFAADHSNLFICDISYIQNTSGKSIVFNPQIYLHTEMVLNLDILPKVSFQTISILNSIIGNIKKCIVLDLDNTLWGGVVGDDGYENIQIGNFGIGKAFSEFQSWLSKLKNRGIILTVCSKNTESVAKEPFLKHPDMILKLDDISVFVANWENKVENIRYIQSVLNIGFDSMVFLDDNPFERNIVKQNIEGICIPELPEDPASYLEFLYELNLFETISVSEEDIQRTKLYQIELERKLHKEKFVDENKYLKSLKMTATIESFNSFNVPRVAQLSQRSNQFNLRTIRYIDSDLEKISASNQYLTFSISLEDTYGTHGIISVVILHKENDEVLFIETWLMSCRVLKRGVEQFVLNHLCKIAKENNFNILKGEYIPSKKNELVKDHYLSLGFEKAGNFWELNIKNYESKLNYIALKNQ
jgi:FkbH-like protein